MPAPLVLIVCEGSETEPRYFEALRQSKCIQKERIRVYSSDDCGCTHPLGLVNAAKALWREHKRGGLVYDEVWVVIDRDQHLSYFEALQAAAAADIHVAFSNPSFELWYLLHFQNQTATIARDDALRQLKGHLSNYDKAQTGMYDLLLAQQPAAIQRAESLLAMHQQNGNLPAGTSPATTVCDLVSFLESLKK